jgi:GTP 3',8-cyclase
VKRLNDTFQRTIDYMRISVTDRCNLRCIYCMPPGGLVPIEHKEILSYEEIVRILRTAVDIGVRKVRITGGEPLIRKNIPYLVQMVKNIMGIHELSMTTNGIFLEQYAENLAEAGLDRVNVSLDSLRPDRYREITRGGNIHAVLRGIKAAEKAGLIPIKINVVPVRGLNDDEIKDFAKMTLEAPYQVRFIEFMPLGMHNVWSPDTFMSTEEIRAIVEGVGHLTPVQLRKSGPARYFRFEGAAGVLGFISPLSNHFCGECNRLRLTADGKLRPCLFSETEIDLKTAMRSDAPDSEIERLIRLSIEVKPEGHNIRRQNLFSHPYASLECNTFSSAYKRPMSKIGG